MPGTLETPAMHPKSHASQEKPSTGVEVFGCLGVGNIDGQMVHPFTTLLELGGRTRSHDLDGPNIHANRSAVVIGPFSWRGFIPICTWIWSSISNSASLEARNNLRTYEIPGIRHMANGERPCHKGPKVSKAQMQRIEALSSASRLFKKSGFDGGSRK